MRLESHYQDLPGRKEVKRLLQKLDEVCHYALDLYKGSLCQRDIDRLHIHLERVERECFDGESQEQCPVVLLSLVLGALSDVWDRTTTPRRREAIGWVLDAAGRVLRYYDRKLNRHEAYAVATRGLVVWDREMAA